MNAATTFPKMPKMAMMVWDTPSTQKVNPSTNFCTLSSKTGQSTKVTFVSFEKFIAMRKVVYLEIRKKENP